MDKNYYEIEQSLMRDYGPRLNLTFRFVARHHFRCPLYKKQNKTKKQNYK